MNYYTSTIPLTLAEKLKRKGMPIRIIYGLVDVNITYGLVDIDVTYGLVFDWLIENKIYCRIEQDYYLNQEDTMGFCWSIFYANREAAIHYYSCQKLLSTWHEAANAAIENAISL